MSVAFAAIPGLDLILLIYSRGAAVKSFIPLISYRYPYKQEQGKIKPESREIKKSLTGLSHPCDLSISTKSNLREKQEKALLAVTTVCTPVSQPMKIELPVLSNQALHNLHDCTLLASEQPPHPVEAAIRLPSILEDYILPG